MSRTLIQVQERERARIARELHDDIGQRLSLAAVALDTLENNLSECESRSRLRQIKEEIFEVVSAAHHVSHELHPSRLKYLGFLPAMEGFCKEVADRYRIDIEFKSEDVPRRLAPDVSLGLLRVLQECLTNAVKHSRVTRVQVLLRGSKHQVNLTVSDLGIGFDVKAALAGDGLGFTSMQERIRSLNGTLVVQSNPRVGTTIHACVPTKPILDFNRMAGSSMKTIPPLRFGTPPFLEQSSEE
jgi:signal transduction histidine kinase